MQPPIRSSVRRPSAQAAAIADANSPDREALGTLRDAAPARLYAGIQLSGALSSTTTGLGQLLANGGLDIFATAASTATYGPVGENPYNNWLSKESKPIVEVVPEAIGLYFGNFGDDADGIVSALAENLLFQLKMDSTVMILQPAFTMPAGLAIDRKVATTKDNVTLTTERFGESSPSALMKFSKGTMFGRDRTLKAVLTPYGGLPAFIQALTGNFPAAGSTLGVVIYGTMALRVGTQR